MRRRIAERAVLRMCRSKSQNCQGAGVLLLFIALHDLGFAVTVCWENAGDDGVAYVFFIEPRRRV